MALIRASMVVTNHIKGALSGLRQFLALECSLKMMKNAFCFTVRARFVLKHLNFWLDFLVTFWSCRKTV